MRSDNFRLVLALQGFYILLAHKIRALLDRFGRVEP